MKQSSGFEAWREFTVHYAGGHRAVHNNVLFAQSEAIMQPTWDSTTEQFTRQYYEWLEDINIYKSENGVNGQGSITQSQITSRLQPSINNLKGPIQQHLMLRINNTTTCTEVHQIDNGLAMSSTAPTDYSGTDDEHGTGADRH
eukprot:6462973-Amphidinium_carterae.4